MAHKLLGMRSQVIVASPTRPRLGTRAPAIDGEDAAGRDGLDDAAATANRTRQGPRQGTRWGSRTRRRTGSRAGSRPCRCFVLLLFGGRSLQGSPKWTRIVHSNAMLDQVDDSLLGSVRHSCAQDALACFAPNFGMWVDDK